MTHTIILNLANNTLTESWQVVLTNGQAIQETETVNFPSASNNINNLIERHRMFSFYRSHKSCSFNTTVHTLIK